MGGPDWNAGTVYLKNLLIAIKQMDGDSVSLSILSEDPLNGCDRDLTSLGISNLMTCPIPQRWTLSWMLGYVSKRLFDRDYLTEKLLNGHNITVMFGPLLCLKLSGVATLSWVPDFQHRLLPEMFSRNEIDYRNRTFQQCANNSSRIILISNTVKRDFDTFMPHSSHKVRVLRPLCFIPDAVYEYDVQSVLSLYHLPERFIYLPNQFWKHKNHGVAFEAVKILKDRGININLVCTGSTLDYRHPTYLAHLWQKLSQWNIRDRVIYLGVLPYEHVLVLMRQSLCVLNPSLFEGWGMTVDEAHRLGKRVLISDIDVHREQDPPEAIFFRAQDGEDLAVKMQWIWSHDMPGPVLEREWAAREQMGTWMSAYARDFLSIAEEAAQEG